MTPQDKARLVHYTGETVVEKTQLGEVLKELESYNGTYSSDFEMNGLVLIQRTDSIFV